MSNDDEDIDMVKMRKISQQIRHSIGHEALTALHEALNNENTKQLIGTSGLFGNAIRHVTLDMAIEDPNVTHLNRGAQLDRLEAKMEMYLTDKAYRHKYAHQARG